MEQREEEENFEGIEDPVSIFADCCDSSLEQKQPSYNCLRGFGQSSGPIIDGGTVKSSLGTAGSQIKSTAEFC